MLREPLKVCLAVIAATVLPAAAAVVMVADARHAALYDSPISYGRHTAIADEAESALQTIGYSVIDVRNGSLPVPRRFVAALPDNMAELDTRTRKHVFIATILPLVLRANEVIALDRARLESIVAKHQMGEALSDLEYEWINDMAASYRVRDRGDMDTIFRVLLRRVDTVPPAIALAQAAIESGWGTSRFAEEGNALFGQWVWNTDAGIVPDGHEGDPDFAIKSFDYLIDSVMDYMLNLNRHHAYAPFRAVRKDMRNADPVKRTAALIATLTPYSTRGEDYVEELSTIIRVNKMNRYNELALEPIWWAGL